MADVQPAMTSGLAIARRYGGLKLSHSRRKLLDTVNYQAAGPDVDRAARGINRARPPVEGIAGRVSDQVVAEGEGPQGGSGVAIFAF